MKFIKVIISLAIIFMLLLTSCGPKPYYKTKEGKKKWKRINSLQYDRQ